ncbi:type VI secretion system-associated FHA domain protein TagH [Sphingomonas sp. PR090111-T3T-6A]|uniref:type VI secretion system-associated FHA domain protein TagH n=1 Tax=Sphingomonas sp. PR090111-T3T-6A TaxID=685778 RepID=UPI00036C5084|nr:type VI secretion system-associated FHA domain protein TagH [Sphingomonas sp. PR090111-T3T-6A]
MTLILTIQDRDTLDNGEPATLRLDRHGAMIGRSTHADWCLPDPRNHISSRHCEISYRDGAYLLADRSTNGTFVNGASERLGALHAIADGDRILIGGYEVVARCPGSEAAEAVAEPQATADAWGDWAPEPRPAASWAPVAERPAAPRVSPPLPDGGGWDAPAPLSRPSPWSSEPREAVPPSAGDIWGQLARESEIDWSQGDFGRIEQEAEGWGRIEAPSETPAPASSEPAVTTTPDGWQAFLRGTGLAPDQVRSAPTAVLANAGAMLRQMVGGLVLMVDARARAKAQLGLQATSLELEGNNPLKFIRAPERALLQLLEPPERGFMDAARAVEDAHQDLQAHQMATLGAMRGALAEVLARFSPAAIRERQETRGWLSRLLSGAREAALWQAYEREFEGVVRGADEAFMDMFAKEFRVAYDRHITEMKARRREG